MIYLEGWRAFPLGAILAVAAVLLAIWWRQQSYRWAAVVALCVLAAPAVSWWSGQAFVVPDYRSGCDGLCTGFRGAPVPFFTGEAAGSRFLPGGFAVNSLVYAVIFLGWTALVRSAVMASTGGNKRMLTQGMMGLALLISPMALAPWYLPAPEAHVRGDSQRVAINARREVYLYDQLVSFPVLRVGLNDVRPRPDGSSGMRVCLRTYTFFYLPTGQMYLDMTPEGVHSNNGGFVPLSASCWQ